MKKIMFSVIAMIAFAGTSFSQKATLDNPWSLEGVLTYTNPDGVAWSAPTVRARYFFKENIAARVQLGLGDGLGTPMSESIAYNEKADGSGSQGTLDINRMAWTAQIGGEYHFAGTDRMSPYVGLGINFGSGSQKQTGTAISTDSTGAHAYNANMNFSAEGKYSMFGVNLLAGMDFYIFKNIYAGLELGLGFKSMTYSDVTSTVSLVTPAMEFKNVTPGHKNTYLSTSAGSAAFRLGWRF